MKDSGSEKKIADNPTAKEMRTILQFFRLMGSTAGLAAKIGIKREAMQKFKSTTDELIANADILELPDRFNSAFSDKGWIATGSFTLDVMRTAVDLHQQGKPQEAESAILDWFTEDNIRLFAIKRARRFHTAHLRDGQLEEALRLYLEERYMAAVPLILIACDGFASDVSGNSPFEKNADLTCFDSITGHQTSLPALMKLFVQGVRKSTDVELDIPKRHGILHGRSLGYANKIVCAKAWLMMVALVDWANDKSSEESRIEERRKKENTSLRETLEQSQRIQNDKKQIEAFQPSENNGPFTGPYEANTAEHALQEFLEGWKNRNFGRMAAHAVNLTRKPLNKMAGEMRDMAERVALDEYEIIRIRHSAIARCDVRVKIRATARTTSNKSISGYFSISIFHNTSDGKIAMPSDKDCIWAVQQGCIYNVMNEKFADDSA